MVSGTTLSPQGDQTDDAVIQAQALSSLGLLMWAGLFLIIQWSLLTAWALAFAG
jgi:hypothetical protein